jgi:HAD superfamily hydrolase (TIGR01509 family)
MFKAIIFDVDGTLSETEDIHRKAFNQAFNLKGLPWHWDRPVYRLLLRISGGKERIRHFVEQYDLYHSQVEDFDGFIRDLHKTKSEIYTQMIANGEAELRPGIRQLITKAIEDGIRLAIATTTSAPNIEALLQSAYGSEGPGIFEVICAGDSVPRKKPAPDIYLLALELLKLPAKDCVAIEDSHNGLLSSSGAGIPTVVTPSIYTDDQSCDEAALVTNELSDVDFAVVFADTRNETAAEKASQRKIA